MNFRKLLCSFLAIVMILSTMSISVLADEVSTIMIDSTKYDTLADALVAAKDGDTITLNSPDVAINAAGVVAGGKTITITGNAKFNWEAGWLFVGRGGEGDGKLIFDNATITTDNTRGYASTGLYISTTEFKNGTDDATKNFGEVEIINGSDIQLSYLRNQNNVTVNNSKLTVYGGFSVAGRVGSETENGEDSTATLTLENGSEVIVPTTNGMGVGYSDTKEGLGVLNVKDSSFIFEKDENVIGPKGEFNIEGEVTIKTSKDVPVATGDVTFKGENKVGKISIQVYTFNIGADASLETTSTDRIVIGHGATLNIEGNISDAKTADVSTLVPSLKITGGASFTGKGVTLNATNAYIDTSVSGYSSTNKSASGTFEFNIENSIWKQTAGKIQFQIGAEPTINFNLTDSVLDLSNYLTVQPKRSTFVADNSIVKATQFENRGDFRILNGSEVTMNSVAESSNGNQPGKITVDNAKFTVNSGQFLGRYMVTANPRVYSDMTGELILKNGAEVSLGGHIKDVFVTVDTSSTLTTSKIDGESIVTIDTANISAGKVKVLDLDETASREGKVTISPELTASGQDVIYDADGDVTIDMYVAKIDEETYPTLQAALNAIKDTEGKTIKLYGTIEEGHVKLPTPFKNLTIDGNPTGARTTGAIIKNTQITDTQGNNFVYDGLTVKNITFDNSNFLLAGRNAGNVYGDIVFDGNRFVNFYNTGNLAPVHMNLAQASTFKSFTFKNNTVENVSGSSNSGVAIKQVEGKTIIENNTFKNISNNAVQVFYADDVEFAKNTIENMGGALLNLNGTTGDISLTENTMLKNSENQKFIAYLSEGKGVSLSNNTWYDKDGEELSPFGDFKAEYDGLYYETLDAATEVAGAGETINLPDGRKYFVPTVKPDTKDFAITFDFDGGQNKNGYISETNYYNLHDAVNAPIVTREGFIFIGWDADGDKKADTVTEKAVAPATYKALWYDKDEYGFKVTLTPEGGTMLKERDMKVNPSDYFIVNVSVSDYFDTGLAWNDADITLTYDTDVFKFVYGEGVTETQPGKLRFTIYGDDRGDKTLAKQISFQALTPAVNANKYGDFVVSEATVDAGWAANRIDATKVREGLCASVYIFYSYDVTLGEGLWGKAIATTDEDYVGKIKDYDPNYDYKVWVEKEDGTLFEAELDGENFTVAKENITGDMKIELQLIGLKGVKADDIEIYEYIAGKVALVLLNAENSREYTYNNAIMYETPWYDTIKSSKIHYGYLVAHDDFTEVGGTLNTEDNKKIALAKIGITKQGDSRTNPAIKNVPGDVNNANALNAVIDINDVQAVWNCYNGNDGEQINVNMPLYLRADICGANKSDRDKKVDSSDVNAVMMMVDLQKNGYQRAEASAELALCNQGGKTYALSYKKGTETVEIVKAEDVSADKDITAEGHNFVDTLDGEGVNMKYIEKCDVCGCVKETVAVSNVFTTLKTAGNKIYGVADVDTAAELMAINKLDANQVFAGGEGLTTTININADIDLAGYEWKALEQMFYTINGNGYTISNINGVENGYTGRGGFLGYCGGSKIKDLTLQNVSVEGSQVGAFVGAGEGAAVTNCTLKGKVKITWKQNYTGSGYVETAGAAGIVAGLNASGGNYDVTIDKNADIVIVEDGRTNELDGSGSWAKEFAPYIQFVFGTLNCNVTDNR